MKRRLAQFVFCLLCVPTLVYGQAHFAPGVANIRDYAEPAPGVYLGVYNYGYITSELTDNSGNKINQIVVGGTPINVNLDVKIYALSPMLLWISDWNLLGLQYGAYIAPTFSNANIAASLSTLEGQAVNPETSQFAVGDLFVCPLWLGSHRPHVDTTVGYGFYAPVGSFSTGTLLLPSGPRVITSPTNVGLGYWTHQLQGNVTWYPSVKRGTAITNTITAEFNTEQRDTNFTNGNYLTWSWGASQYLPLDKQIHYLADVGVTGYSEWQISDSSGPNVTNPSFHTQVHGIGVQAGFISVRRGLQLLFHYYHEYYSANRLQGNSYSFDLGYTIKGRPAVPAAP